MEGGCREQKVVGNPQEWIAARVGGHSTVFKEGGGDSTSEAAVGVRHRAGGCPAWGPA